jgi:hypothetical protein
MSNSLKCCSLGKDIITTSAIKYAFFSKTNVMTKFLQKTAMVEAKSANLFA